MSYAEHGSRIFLSGRLSNDISLIYGDCVSPRIRSEGPLKLHHSCTDIRAWSPNDLENSRYLREFNEHNITLQTISFNVIVEGMIDLTSRATNELRNVRQELRKYKLLPLTQEQKSYLDNFNKAITNFQCSGDDSIFDLKRNLREAHNFFLTNTYAPKENLFLSLSSESKTCLVSAVTSCDEFVKVKDKEGCDKQSNIYVEYVDAFLQVMQDVCEVGIQTQISEHESGDIDICEKSHKKIIIQKDSEIIVLENELEIKKDELDELRELNTYLQLLLKKEKKNTDTLRHNLNSLQENLKLISNKRIDEVKSLTIKLSSSEYLLDHLKAELGRKCQVCYFQSQEIQKLRTQVKETELLSVENESLTQKVKEMEHLSREMDCWSIGFEQIKNIKRERNMFQKQYREQSFTLADREDEIKKLLMLIKQISLMADTREVKMNDVVTNLKYEIQSKNDKISQCEMQLVSMEKRINNLTNKLKSSLSNLDVSMGAYKVLCECVQCEHNCLDIQSALSALNAFIIELEKCKLEQCHQLLELDNLQICMACYRQKTVSEVTSIDFNTKDKSIQSIAETVSISSNCSDCHSSRKLVNVKIQSDDSIMACFQQKVELNGVILSEKIDRILAIHIKQSIHKMHKIFTILQGIGDQHVQIIKEYARQQRDIEKKDFEITELKQKIAEHMLQRNENTCMIQKQLKKKMFNKKIETVISKRDIGGKSRQDNFVLENTITDYRETKECETKIKIKSSDLINEKNGFAKENDARNEELATQRDQICKLIEQIEQLKQTIVILKEETSNIDDMRKKLIDLQIRNNYLRNKLIQANETIAKSKVVGGSMYEDEENKMILQRNIKHDTAMMHGDIVKLREENRSLHDQLKETEIKLAQSNDTILLLRSESNSMVIINFLRMDLSHLEKNKEELLAKINYLKTEIASSQSVTTSVENKLQILWHKNETLKADIEIVKNSNNQLLFHENMNKRSLKDILSLLPGKIYEKVINCLQIESKKMYASKQCQVEKTATEDKITQQQIDSFQQSEQLLTSQNAHNIVHSITLDCNSENTACKLMLLGKQHEEKVQEIKSLMDQINLRNYETKNLQEYVTYLIEEKNNLQNTIKCQSEEYENKLALLKKKYDNSLNAFRKRHNENVERLQARYEDIMKVDKNTFNVEIWLQSLNFKELSELHNRINNLSLRAVKVIESDIKHITSKSHNVIRNKSKENNSQYNKFILYKQRDSKTFLSRKTSNKKSTSEFSLHKQTGSKVSLTTKRKTCKRDEVPSKKLNIENKVAIREVYSRDLKLKYEYRSVDNGKQVRTENTEVLKSHRDKTLDWQREKFIYQCSIYHKSTAN